MSDQTVATFAFKQVETVLAEFWRIADDRRGAFLSRLQQLHRMGVPTGAKVGRGARVAYTALQILETALALELLDIGATPSLAVDIVRWFSCESTLVERCKEIESEGNDLQKSMQLIIYPNALGYLGIPGSGGDSPKNSVVVVKFRDGDEISNEIINSHVVINFSKMVQSLLLSMAKVGQQASGDRFF